MKKCILFLSALMACGIITAYAAVPTELGGKELVELGTIAQTDFDGEVTFSQYDEYAGFVFNGVTAQSADSTPENPKTDVMPVLRDPSDPDSGNYCLKVSRTKTGDNRRVNLLSSKNYSGSIWVFNFEYMQPTSFEQWFSLKLDNAGWFYGDRFYITAAGELWFGSKKICSGIRAGNWYEYTLIFDAEANTASAIVKGIFNGISSEMTIIEKDMPVKDRQGNVYDFSYIEQMEMNCSSVGRVFYVDSLSQKAMAYRPQLEACGIDAAGNETEDGLINNEMPRVRVAISEAIQPDTIGAKPVTMLQNGTEIAADVSFEPASNSFIITPNEALPTNTEYTFVVASGMVTKHGLPVDGATLRLKSSRKSYNISRAFEEGEYLTFGRYGGEPIVWKVLSEDSEGCYLIADKVLSFKAFDALGGTWKDSSLRTWLNAEEANVSYLHAPQIGAKLTENPYDTEKGFLHSDNFTPQELQMLLTCDRDVIVYTTGTSQAANHTSPSQRGYIRDPKTAQSSAKFANTESVSDKIFLPSVADIQLMAQSSESLGVEYQVGTPTAYAAEQSGSQLLQEGRACSYWMSDALYFAAENDYVYTMSPGNVISYARSYNGLTGVRPMCKIKSTGFFVAHGNGSAESPYGINCSQGIFIRPAQEIVMSGDPIPVIVNSTYASDTDYVVYVNDTPCADYPVACEGNNEIYYKVYASDGTLLSESNRISVWGLAYNNRSNIMMNDFEGSNLFAGFQRHSALGDYLRAVEIDEEHGTSLEMKSGNGTSVTAAFPNFSKTDITALEFDFMLPSTDVIDNYLVYLKIYESGTWIRPLLVSNGTLSIGAISTPSETVHIQAGQWYHVALYMDQSNPSLTVTVTENGERRILCYRAPYADTVDRIAYGELTSTGNSTSRINTVCFDNISLYRCNQNNMALRIMSSRPNGQANVSIYNPSGEEAELVVFGVVHNQDRLIECQKQTVVLEKGAISRTVSFDFASQGSIRCIATDRNLTPFHIFTAE